MKQTVAVMAIIVALLLMVSGYIVAQHAETSAELRRVQVQLGEKQVEVQKAKREKQLFENRAEELTTQKETLEKELADAKASIDEANAAVAQTVDERAQSEAAFAGQNQLLESQVEDWETRYQELMGINNSLTVERDAAL